MMKFLWISKFLWIAAIMAFSVLETMTVQLVCIWFAAGALAALLASILGFRFLTQLTVFAVVTAVCLALTRPLVRRYASAAVVPTNADRVLGTLCRVTETVDAENGAVYADGKTWSARSVSGATIPVGAQAKVERLEGVKLYISEAV